jgi:hypothetical protein
MDGDVQLMLMSISFIPTSVTNYKLGYALVYPMGWLVKVPGRYS